MFLYDRDSLSILEAPKSIELENIPLFDGKNGRPGEAAPMKNLLHHPMQKVSSGYQRGTRSSHPFQTPA